MFYHLLAFSVVFLNQLCYFHYSKAENTDFVLTFFAEESRSSRGYITIPQKSTKGDGLSFCSWIKLKIPAVGFFEAVDTETSYASFFAYVSFTDHKIYGVIGNLNDVKKTQTVAVEDSNLKDFTSWFHVCVVMNQTTYSFYLNGTPSENYVQTDKISTMKTNIELRVGDILRSKGNGSLFQSNAFDRVITAKEAQNMYNCKHIAGDLLAWKDITSKSTGIQFLETILLEQDTVPCPDLPSSENPGSSSGDPGSSSGDPGSSSGDPGASSEDLGASSGDPGASSGDPGASSENPGASSGDPGSSSGNPNPGSDLGNSNSGRSSQNVNAGNSPGSTGN